MSILRTQEQLGDTIYSIDVCIEHELDRDKVVMLQRARTEAIAAFTTLKYITQ
jgi:hypothetical protein